MITLNCPDCGKKYELEDGMAGKKAACECGAVLFVPDTPDVPEGKQLCPVCRKIIDKESVICVECGYNFQTGGRMRSAETRTLPPDDPKLTFFRRIIKPALLILVLLIAGMIVYKSFYAKHYGISSANRLGTLNAIEAHLKTNGFEKLDVSNGKLPDIFGKGVKKYEWKDVKLTKLSKGMYNEKVFIIVSSDNEVLAVGANFKGGVKSIPGDTGSRTGRFMSSLWKETGLQFPPEYKDVTKKYKYSKISFRKGESTHGSIRGEWIVFPSDISIIPDSHTMIITFAKFADISYKKLQGGRFQELEKFENKYFGPEKTSTAPAQNKE